MIVWIIIVNVLNLMAYQRSARVHLARWKRAGELKRIPFEVDPHLEITEFADRAVKTRRSRAAVRKAEGLAQSRC